VTTLPLTINPDSRAETNSAESFPSSQKTSPILIFLLAVRSFLVYKGRKKGGELMKIKVNVRAGGAIKAR